MGMKKHGLVLGCILGLAMTIQAMPVAAQGSPTGEASKAPAAAPSKAPAVDTQSPATTAIQPASPWKDQKEKVSYAIGMNVGSSFHRASVEVDLDVFLRGLKDSMAGGKTLMTEDEAHATIAQFLQEAKAKQAETNKKEGESFLAENKTKEGVVVLPSGLQYKIVTQGSGPKPTPSDTVVCNYRGALINGTEFDSSYKSGKAATFQVGGVIKGWAEALQLMAVGSKWQLFIPPDLAYGDRGAGTAIGPGVTLIFEVELLSIQEKNKPEKDKQ
jgi:FKBP-type peptidyl-prolyl cis-trans isomerase FklB